MSRICALLLVCACGDRAFLSDAWAWDGQRKGLLLGAGAGVGFTHSSFSDGDESHNDFAVGTDLRIGYAPTNQVGIFWMSKAAWLPHAFDAGFGTWAHGVAGPGVAYHYKPSAPSPYLLGGVGYSIFRDWDEPDVSTDYGFGFAIGGGYELVRHISAEGVLTWGNPDDSTALSVIGAITFLGY